MDYSKIISGNPFRVVFPLGIHLSIPLFSPPWTGISSLILPRCPLGIPPAIFSGILSRTSPGVLKTFLPGFLPAFFGTPSEIHSFRDFSFRDPFIESFRDSFNNFFWNAFGFSSWIPLGIPL